MKKNTKSNKSYVSITPEQMNSLHQKLLSVNLQREIARQIAELEMNPTIIQYLKKLTELESLKSFVMPEQRDFLRQKLCVLNLQRDIAKLEEQPEIVDYLAKKTELESLKQMLTGLNNESNENTISNHR